MEKNYITIPLDIYKYLVQLEARVDVAVERIANQEFIHNEDVLRILGTEDALIAANRLREKDERRIREQQQKYEFAGD